MPSWKKVITSGSNAHLNQLTASSFNLLGSGTGELEVEGNITASGNISSSGTLTGAGLNVVGTSNLDAVDIDSTVQIDGNTTFGVNGTGVDVKFYGDTTNRRMQWDQSEDQLKFYDNTQLAFGTGVAEAAHDAQIVFDGSDLIIQTAVMGGASNSDIILSPQISKAVVVSGSGDTKLSVEGNISSTGIISGSTALNLGYKPDGGTYISASSDGVLEISGSGNATLSVEGHITSSGNISGSGDSHTFGGTLTVEDDTPIIKLIDKDGGGNDMRIQGSGYHMNIKNAQNHSNADLYIGTYNEPYALYVDNSATSVGIGTNTPDSNTQLDINGALQVQGNITASGDIESGDDVVLTSAQARIQNTSAETSLLFGSADSAVVSIVSGSSTSVTVPFYFDTKNQRMGIKTALPTVPLQVEGTISGSTIDATTHKFSKTGTTDGTHQGDVVYIGSTSTNVGQIYHYKSDGTWELADADAASTSDGLLGVALGGNSTTNGMLLRGMVTLDHDPGEVGDVLFLATGGTGQATATAPSGGSDIIRVIGYCLDASNGQIWFNPDNTFVEHS